MEVQTGEQGSGNTNGGSNQDDESWMSDPTKVKEYVVKLRNENKTRRQSEKDLQTQLSKTQGDLSSLGERVKKLAGGDENEPPEKQVETLKTKTQQAEAERDAARAEIAFRDFAADAGITAPKERRHLQFLLSELQDEKGDDYEITDEDVAGLVQEIVNVRPAGGNKPGATSFGGKTPAPEGTGSGGGGQVTLDQFKVMGTADKSVLYGRDPELYNKLQSQLLGRK